MNRRIAALALIVAILVGLAITLPRFVSLDVLVRNEDWLRALIHASPVQAWFVGFLVYFLVSLVPGTSGKSVVCGWLFGFWQAVLMVDVALSTAALVMFWISRSLMRQSVESRFAYFLDRLNRHLLRDGPFYLLVLRLAHTPFTVLNYSCGALDVRTRTFLWTTLCGLLPGTTVFVFAGTQLPTLREIQDQGVIGLVEPGLLVALAATAVLPFGIRAVVRRYRLTNNLRRDSCISP